MFMKKSELKRLIKECIRESIFSDTARKVRSTLNLKNRNDISTEAREHAEDYFPNLRFIDIFYLKKNNNAGSNKGLGQYYIKGMPQDIVMASEETRQIYFDEFVKTTRLPDEIKKSAIADISDELGLTGKISESLEQEPPLIDAIFNNDAAEVLRLLSKGVDPNTLDSRGTSALAHALGSSHPRSKNVIKYLLIGGAEVTDEVEDEAQYSMNSDYFNSLVNRLK